MAFEKARVLLSAGSVLALAACGSVPAQHAQAGPAATQLTPPRQGQLRPAAP